jgi:hypothetical protein
MSAGVIAAGAPAQALTVIPISTGPFSLPGNASGVIPPGVIASGAETYDFTFTTIGGTYRTLMQMQSSKVSNGHPVQLSFALYKGNAGTGSFVANSGGTPTAATLLTLTSGNYYMQFVPKVAAPQLVTGGVTLLSSVPEPAAWATMILGMAAIGGLARTRRRAAALAA